MEGTLVGERPQGFPDRRPNGLEDMPCLISQVWKRPGQGGFSPKKPGVPDFFHKNMDVGPEGLKVEIKGASGIS